MNIWNVEADVVCIPVNCQGVMGAGLAKQCRLKHPNVFKHYQELCKDGSLSYGGFAIIREGGKLFAMLPTKDHWRDKSSLFDVLTVFSKLLTELMLRLERDEALTTTVAVPMLGAGLGGLNEDEVRANLEGICAEAQERNPRLRCVLC